MPEETIGAADTAACDCDSCRKRNGLPHGITPGVIHGYSSAPRGGWRARRTAAEDAAIGNGERPAPTFGVELETSVPSFTYTDLPDRPTLPHLPYEPTAEQSAEYTRLAEARRDWTRRNLAHRERQQARFVRAGNMSAEEAVSLAAPRGLWHSKHDGSVSGPEFASQPGTLAYWRSQRGHLVGMFRGLLHGGMRSHDGDTCGLHVNIGTDAFNGEDGRVNADHLYRLATLLHVNPRWSTRMSQRTNASARWARYTLTDAAERRDWADSIARYGYATNVDRYSVLNAQNSGRVEFRLPRGTLRYDRFMAKLEWTAAMVEYTRDAHNVAQPSAFMRWVAARESEYPYLLGLMRERFNAARFGEVD
jgi:hypothetical protein